MGDWGTFIAIGDSFTEGLDDWRPDGTPRGWADRVAERLGRDDPGFRYANLAVRGKLLDQIVDDQVPVAERLRPDLVAFCAGGNDIIRFSCDTDDLARRFDDALGRITATGAHGPRLHRLRPGPHAPADPQAARAHRLLQRADAGQRRAPRRHGRRPVGDDTARRPPHLGTATACTSPPRATAAWRCGCWSRLGEPVADDWRAPLPGAEPTPWRDRQLEDLRWMREWVLPFVASGCRAATPATASGPSAPSCSPFRATGRAPPAPPSAARPAPRRRGRCRAPRNRARPGRSRSCARRPASV